MNKIITLGIILLLGLLSCDTGGNGNNDNNSNDMNSAPTDIILGSIDITEGLPAGSEVGTLSVIDADSSDSFTFQFADGYTDNSFFSIIGNQLLSVDSFEYESKHSYFIAIIVNDGFDDFEKEFTIQVNREIETIQWQDDGEGWLQYKTNDTTKDDEFELNVDLGTHDFTVDSTFIYESKRISGSTRRNYGLIFCADMDNGNAYIMHIDSIGEYFIMKYSEGSEIYWGEDYDDPADYGMNDHTNRPHSAIKTALGETNKIQIMRTGSNTFEITINDDTDNIINLTDDRGDPIYSSGDYGFNVHVGGDFPNYPLDTRFRVVQ